MLRNVLLSLLLLSLVGCSNSPTAPSAGDRVSITTVLAASYSGIDRKSQVIILDGDAWSRAWNEIHSRQTPRPPLPAIDFAHEMLLLASLGERSDGCHGIEIRAAEVVGSRLRVVIEEATSAATCGCTQALVQPVHVVRLPRSSAPVAFESRQVTVGCS